MTMPSVVAHAHPPPPSSKPLQPAEPGPITTWKRLRFVCEPLSNLPLIHKRPITSHTVKLNTHQRVSKATPSKRAVTAFPLTSESESSSESFVDDSGLYDGGLDQQDHDATRSRTKDDPPHTVEATINPFNPGSYALRGFSRARLQPSKPSTTASKAPRDISTPQFIQDLQTHSTLLATSPFNCPMQLKQALANLQSTSTSSKLRVRVSKLYNQTLNHIQQFQINILTGEPESVVPLPMDFMFKSGGGLHTMEEQMEYLHGVFMWIVEGCLDVQEHTGKGKFGGKKYKGCVKVVAEKGLHSEVGTEKTKTKPSTSTTSKTDPSSLSKIKTALQLLSTPKELNLVRTYLHSIRTRSRIPLDALDLRQPGPQTHLSLKDWSRLRESDQGPKWERDAFSVTNFIKDYLKMHRALVAAAANKAGKQHQEQLEDDSNGEFAVAYVPPAKGGFMENRNARQSMAQRTSGAYRPSMALPPSGGFSQRGSRPTITFDTPLNPLAQQRRKTRALNAPPSGSNNNVQLNQQSGGVKTPSLTFSVHDSESKRKSTLTIPNAGKRRGSFLPGANSGGESENYTSVKFAVGVKNGSLSVEGNTNPTNNGRNMRRSTLFNPIEENIPSSSSSTSEEEEDDDQEESRLYTPAEILASPTINPWMYFHNECVQMLQKPGWERTQEEIRVLTRVMRGLKAFDKFSDFILKEVCGVARFNAIEPMRAVFRQGEVGSAWYIILKGSVKVQITRTGRIEDTFTVSKLGVGDGFGDLALVNDQPRAATIVTLEKCELVRIEKTDYNRVLKFVHDKTITEMAYFLRTIPAFESWTKTALRSIAGKMSFKKMKVGETIIEEGDPCKEVFFIRSGKVSIYKSTIIDGKKKNVLVATRGPRQYICEEGVIEEIPAKKVSHCTVRVASCKDSDKSHSAKIFEAENEQEITLESWMASSHASIKKKRREPEEEEDDGELVVAVVNAVDFPFMLKPQEAYGMTPEEILAIHRLNEAKVIWEKTRREQLNRMVKEVRGDCNATYF
ncbi:hypothetical protein HDV05_004039 [Chytridiales sp. JEL 0842]|nr:hypothetical protein HDV05_004039 [Chytridiales sp. JEL 0842]